MHLRPKRNLPPGLWLAAIILLTLLLGACDNGAATPEEQPAAPEGLEEEPLATAAKIDGYILEDSRQIDDNTMEYTYRARLSNDDFPASQVTARIVEAPDGITLIDDTLNFDTVAANGRQESRNSFVLRHDLGQPFRVEDLVWAIEAEREASLSIEAGQLELRLGLGESRDIHYSLLAYSPAGVTRELILRESVAPGLRLGNDNSGAIRLAAGSNSYRLGQTLTAVETGRFELNLRASLPGAGLERHVRISVIVEADSDGDGVPDELDLCPDSTAGDSVDNAGCAATDVVDSSAFRDLQVGQITFRVREDNLEEHYMNGMLTSLNASGSLLLLTPMGEMVIQEAELVFEYGAGGLGGIERLRGTAQVPFPDLGILAGAEIGTPAMADVGLDYGSNLADLEAPLVDDRQYLFFRFSAGFEASVGAIGFEAPGGQSITFALDPQDPFFFLTGSLAGLSEIAGVEDLGIAMSLQGLIPFVPDTTWGIGDDIGNFDANLYLQGVIPFARLPLNLDGSLVVDVDANDDGNTLFNSLAPDVEYGGNGTLNVGVDFLKFFSFGFELGSASLGIKLAEEGQQAYFSGQLDPDTDFLPQELVPIRPSNTVNMAGLISDDIARSFLRGEGEYRLDASTLSRFVGAELNDLTATSASFSADRNGVRLTGLTRSSIYPGVGFDGDAQLDAHFTGVPGDWGIGISGNMDIAGTPISQGQLNVSSAGLSLSGDFVTPLTRIGMSGQIDARGIEMRGNTGITIPISVVEAVSEWVVDGAICGYEKVTDAAICGAETVTNGAICGYNTVTSAAICGTRWVTDIATCGWSLITGQGGCNVAKTCQVAKSCSVPKSCDIPRGCYTSVDLNLPKGEFRGDIALLLGNQGIGGEVSGDYCFNGDCTTLSGGRIKAGSDGLEACITIPGGIGEVCTPF